jgi:serine/threonine-protein kinase
MCGARHLAACLSATATAAIAAKIAQRLDRGAHACARTGDAVPPCVRLTAPQMDTTSVVCEEGTARIPAAGDVVSGKYRLLRPLGEGGMGLVFEAEHLRLRQSVAIKFLRQEVLALPDAVERFEREARASARIRGPHVVQVLDVDTDERGRPYMVMELLRGRDLEAELRVHGPFPIAAAVDLVLQACVAVAQAHAAGIVHRDLKPSNLFLSEESGKRVLKVLDFGISKIATDVDTPPTSATSACVTVGTPLYMSPEQMRSSKDVDGRSDIWSLGVILYELVAGTPPFLGTTTAAIAAIVADAMPSLRHVRPDVPEALERVLVTALAKVPADRLPTAEALGAALMPFASADGVAGPFSLRPSQHDFALAVNAMARTPASQRVSEAQELLTLPPSRRTRSPESRARRRQARREALRTFAGTLVIGMVLASATTAVIPRRSATAPVVSGSTAPPPRVRTAADIAASGTSAGPTTLAPVAPARLMATSAAALEAGQERNGKTAGTAASEVRAPFAELASRRRSAPSSNAPAAAVRRVPPAGAGSATAPHREASPTPSPYL